MNGMKKQDEIDQALAALERDGRLTVDDVVDAARDPDSPLHGEFEWDDTVAAELYRRTQARRLIVTVRHRSVENARIIVAPAYVRDASAATGQQGYTRTISLQDDQDKARATVLNELERVAAHLARARAIAAAIGLDGEFAALEGRFLEVKLLVERQRQNETPNRRGRRA